MSANNQIVVAPFPEDLEKWAVWYDGCVDNPFDFGGKPMEVFDKLEDAMNLASKELGPDEMGFCVEYGIRFVPRETITGYANCVWDEFPEYKYLAPVARLSELKPA